MKVQSLSAILVSVGVANAFCPQQQRTMPPSTSLQASKKSGDFWAPVATAALGWTLAAQVATAVPVQETQKNISPMATSSVHMAALPVKEQPTYQQMDLSLPSYSSSSYGFGDVTEAKMGNAQTSSDLTDPGADEAAKQAAAAKKAEQAKQIRLEEKRKAAKEREAEDRRRKEAKAKERAARARAIFE